MIDPITLFFYLAMLSWLIGLCLIIGQFIDPYSDCMSFGIIMWLFVSLPLTGFWAFLWVIVNVFG